MLTIPIRSVVRSFQPYTAGLSIEEIRQKYNLDRVIKLASNENPIGVSPLVQEAICKRAGLAFRYPQSGNPRLKAALARKLGVNTDRIVTGNGSDEIIDLLFRVTATSGVHNVVVFQPCFGLYPTQAALCGIELRRVMLNTNFSFPFEKALSLVDENTALIFVTTPDNPSGHAVLREELLAFAEKIPETCLLVVDEAYIDFTDNSEKYSILSDMPKHLIDRVAVLRTFSKVHGMAGLRLGYGIMPPEIADYMWRIRLPFSVNILAEEGALAALEDTAFYSKTLEVVRCGRTFLSKELTQLGCHVFPSQANFLMFIPPKGVNAHKIFNELLKQGLILRPLDSYGLPDFLRVSIGNSEENKYLITVLHKLLGFLQCI